MAAIVVAIPAGAHVQAAVLLSFGVGTGVALWQLRRARQEAERARAEQERATAVTRFIASTFSQAVPRQGAGGIVTAADLLHSAHARVRDELGGQPLVAAELLTIIGDSFHELGDVEAARTVLPDAVERCELAFGRTHPVTLHARTGLAHARVLQGDLVTTEGMLPSLLSQLRAAMPKSASDLAAALRHSSYALTKRGDVDAAIAALEEALAIAREHVGPSSRDTLVTAGLLSNTLATFGRDEAAIEVLLPAVETARGLYGTKRPNSELAQLESFLAGSLLSVGRLGEAEALLRPVLADQWALDGCDTMRNLYTRQMLAMVRANRGDLEEGIVLMRESLAADARLHATPTVDTGTMTAILGEMMVESGQFDEGLATIERAEAIVIAAGGAGQEFPSLRRQLRRAHCLLVAGRPAPALAEADALLARLGADDSWIGAVALRVRVAALRELARVDEADALVPAMLLAAQSPAVNASNRSRALMEAAQIGLARGRAGEAAPRGRDALELLQANQLPESRLLRRARDLAERCAAAAAAESGAKRVSAP